MLGILNSRKRSAAALEEATRGFRRSLRGLTEADQG